MDQLVTIVPAASHVFSAAKSLAVYRIIDRPQKMAAHAFGMLRRLMTLLLRPLDN